MGGLELKPIIAKALQMGDELHNRHVASSSLFANAMAVAMAETECPDKGPVIATLKYITNHELIFLGSPWLPARPSPTRRARSSTAPVVTAMAATGRVRHPGQRFWG